MRSPVNQKHIGTAQGWHSWQSRQWSMCLVFLKGTLWEPQIISNQCIVSTPQGYLHFDFSTSPSSQNDVPELGFFFYQQHGPSSKGPVWKNIGLIEGAFASCAVCNTVDAADWIFCLDTRQVRVGMGKVGKSCLKLSGSILDGYCSIL